MKMITGRTGSPHIEPEHDALWHKAIIGKQTTVLNESTTTNFQIEIVSNNEIKIRSGIGMIQGRKFCVEKEGYDSVNIMNGAQGYKRTDIIVARYNNNVETNTQSMEWVVIQGEQAESSPQIPEHEQGDLDAGDAVADFPMFRVDIDGINITGVTPVFEVAATLENCRISSETIAMYEELGFDLASAMGGTE